MSPSIIARLSGHACWVAAVAAILWPALDAVAQDKQNESPPTVDAPDQESGPSRWWLGLE